jgi:hypothetical protein
MGEGAIELAGADRLNGVVKDEFVDDGLAGMG